ncbi:MAG: glycoside hydrolase family 3 N-terminal domain-containing protein [Bacteroidota bacterium]
MKKFFRIIFIILGILLLALVITGAVFYVKWNRASKANLALLGSKAPFVETDSISYYDLNKNGSLDVYEDRRAPLEARVEDLLEQMDLSEKAGLMFITMIGMNADGTPSEIPSPMEPFTFALESNASMIAAKKMNHFNIVQSTSKEAMLIWHNNIQEMALQTRLGIPVTIASDPRHGAVDNPGASIPTPFFSKWCSPIGFAAIGDTTLMQDFGNIARQEYRALGIRLALSPMADLATEPRWGRIAGTFGEDAAMSKALTKAYIKGFQGDSLGWWSVACMTKHFPGGGPQKDGEDAHFPYGAEQAYPGGQFDYHLIPFEGAFDARTAQIMPYYGLPVGQTEEAVAFAYNKEIITDLLRDSLGFDGVVCTDWGLITNSIAKPASAYGVEDLSEEDRAVKILEAGCDMFGGEARPELVISAVKAGKLSEERLDQSIRRILRDKFRLGLFDQPYLDPAEIQILGEQAFDEKGEEAQRRSLVLLKNEDNILPLPRGKRLFVEGFSPESLKQYGYVTENIEEADYVLLKSSTPYEPRSEYLLERFFHQGRLDFPEEEEQRLLNILESKPAITVMSMDRPAVIPDISLASRGLIADFFCEDKIILELIFGEFSPSGKLPFEMPSSMVEVHRQAEDVPYDTDHPLYTFGHGLSYGSPAEPPGVEADSASVVP